MLRIKAYPAPSGTHGLGLFAGEPVKEGQIIWEFSPFIDQVYSQRKFLSMCRTLCDVEIEHILSSSYKRNKKFYYLTDNTRFINHDEINCNVMLVDDKVEVALRDIEAGEELLENYFMNYDADDFFTYELRNVSVSDYLTRHISSRKSNVKNQHLS